MLFMWPGLNPRPSRLQVQNPDVDRLICPPVAPCLVRKQEQKGSIAAFWEPLAFGVVKLELLTNVQCIPSRDENPYGGFQSMRVRLYRWMVQKRVVENPTQMDDLGYPTSLHFRKLPYQNHEE